jgi:hypothetical protein
MLWWKIKVEITEYHRKLIALEEIGKFLNLCEEDLPIPDKPNMNVNDYCLKHFQWRVWRQIDLLDPNNKKWRKRKW